MGIFKKHKNTKPTNTWNANTINKLIQPVTCGPECQKAQRDETLRRSYDQSLLNMKEAPDKVKVAEKEYYISMNGSEFYNNVLICLNAPISSPSPLSITDFDIVVYAIELVAE